MVDSNVLVGAVVEKDQHHDEAKPIFDGINEGRLTKAYVTEYVLAEVLNTLTSEFGKSQFNRTKEFVGYIRKSDEFRLAGVDSSLFNKALTDKFLRYPNLSLVDAIIVEFMISYSVECLYSFDDDFDPFDDIFRLKTDTQPY